MGNPHERFWGKNLGTWLLNHCLRRCIGGWRWRRSDGQIDNRKLGFADGKTMIASLQQSRQQGSRHTKRKGQRGNVDFAPFAIAF